MHKMNWNALKRKSKLHLWMKIQKLLALASCFPCLCLTFGPFTPTPFGPLYLSQCVCVSPVSVVRSCVGPLSKSYFFFWLSPSSVVPLLFFFPCVGVPGNFVISLCLKVVDPYFLGEKHTTHPCVPFWVPRCTPCPVLAAKNFLWCVGQISCKTLEISGKYYTIAHFCDFLTSFVWGELELKLRPLPSVFAKKWLFRGPWCLNNTCEVSWATYTSREFGLPRNQFQF